METSYRRYLFSISFKSLFLLSNSDPHCFLAHDLHVEFVHESEFEGLGT